MTKIDKQLQTIETELSQLELHKQREAKFAVEANERFEKNLNAFEKYFPNIYQEIIQFSPRSDFAIHVTRSGHGNFFMKDSAVAIYGDDPVAQVTKQYEENRKNAKFAFFDFMSSAGVFDEAISMDERLHVKYMKSLSELYSRYKGKLGHVNTELPEYYPAALIFGCGLGYQLSLLVERHDFEFMFVDEPDFEVFYASLYCSDWFDIIQKIDAKGGRLYLSIGVSTTEFFELVENVSAASGACSLITSFCYQHYPSEEVNKAIQHYFNSARLLHSGYGFYNDAVTGLAHGIKNLQNGVNFLTDMPQISDVKKSLANVPLFVVGNGPSLDDSIEFIRQHQNSAIIIAAGTAYQSLINAGVKADFQVLVERPYSQYEAVQAVSDAVGGYSDTNLLGVDVLYPEISKLYKWSGFGLKGPEAATTFLYFNAVNEHGVRLKNLPYCGPMVSNLAASYGLVFGFKEIFLFGVDNGYPAMKTHSDLAVYNDPKMQKKGFNAFSVDSASIELEGNIEGTTVLSDILYNSSRDNLRKLADFDQSVDFYNVGAGAKVDGMIPVYDCSSILMSKPIDKEKLIDDIKNTFFCQLQNSQHIERQVNCDEFDDLCDYILEISSRPFESRKEAYSLLRAQQNVVFAYASTQSAHLYHMLKGSMLYYHSPMVNNLFSFNDNDQALLLFRETLELWCNFVKDMRSDYRLNWSQFCTLSEFNI